MAVAEGPSRGGGLLGEGRWVEYRNAALGCCDIEDGNAVGSRRLCNQGIWEVSVNKKKTLGD